MLRRSFHSSLAPNFKQKAAAALKKNRVPDKKKGSEYRNYRYAASYSGFHKLAPDVPGLGVLSPNELAVGMFTYPDTVQASLIHAGSFPPQQNSELFRTHTSLFRDQTVSQAQTLDQSRKLLLGPSGVGKSTLLSQLQAVAKVNNWAIIHIPHAETLIDGSTDHVASGDRYLQPLYIKRWFSKLRKANRSLSGEAVKILKSHDPAGLDELFTQINKDGTKILFSVDGINAWSHQPFALNRTKNNEEIYHADLQVPRIFLEYLSGARKLDGAVIATTTGRYATDETINAGIGRCEAPAYAPISQFDPVLSSRFANVEPVDVSYMSADEARVWLEYLHQAGVAPQASEQLVNERHAVSGGNPRHLLQSFITYSF